MDRPYTDQREYRHITLPNNKLRCLLIHDVKAEKSAAAMGVGVGQLHDANLPGLAHLTEHLLFMGTKKFPNENEFDKYLSSVGGHSNAYTNLELTCYYLDCQQGSTVLDGALDRFASCFTQPLLSINSLEKEINAIDSEHAKNVTSDHWRFDHLSRTILGRFKNQQHEGKDNGSEDSPASHHPYASFGSGNRESLVIHDMDTLRNAVEGFWKQYYVAENMTLSILGNVGLDELERLVTLYFSDVPSSSSSSTRQTDTSNSTTVVSSARPQALSPLSPPLPLCVYARPMRDHLTIELQWPLREIQSLYEPKPSRFISHLLGHEGPGSLLSCLRECHYAQELVADDMSKSCHDFSIFSIELEVTPLGFQHVNDIIALVFAYINLLGQNGGENGGGIPSWVFDELKASSELQFRFLSDRPPSDTVASLVDAMHQYPPNRVLSGPYKLFVDEHPAQEIQDILKYLTPNNVLVIQASKDVETDQVDKWYGTCYKEVVVDEATRELWMNPPPDLVKQLRLPDRNDMMPTNFELITPHPAFVNNDTTDKESSSYDLPRCLKDTSTCRVWYKPDTVFKQPKVNLLVLLRTPMVYVESPLASNLSSVYAECLQEHAKDFSYAASMAGLHCDFQNTRNGLEIHVSGYNHKVSILLERILDAIRTLPESVTPEILERIVDKTRNQLTSFLVAAPYQHAIYASDLCLEDSKWTYQDRLSALDDVTHDSLLHFASRVMQRLHMEVLVHGNVSAPQALELSDALVQQWNPQPLLYDPPNRVVQLQSPCSVYRFRGWNEPDTNSCVLNVYQIGVVDLHTNAKLSLLQHLLREPAFNQLRTEEQLGYIVHSGIKTNGDSGIKGWMCLIQSDSFDPMYMDERIELFLQTFRSKILVPMSDEDFTTNVESVCQNLLEANKNLGEESSKYWGVIANRTYKFRRLAEIASHVQQLTKLDALRFLDKYLLQPSPYRRKLSIQVFGKNHTDDLPVANDNNHDKQSSTSESIQAEQTSQVTSIRDPIEFRNLQPLFPSNPVVSIADRMLVVEETIQAE